MRLDKSVRLPRVTIRKATQRDLHLLTTEAGDFYIQPLVIHFKKNITEKEKKSLPIHDPLTFVAIHSGQIVGYAQQRKNGGIIFISTRKGFDRRGIGRKLIGKLSARLIKMGASTLELTSNSTLRARNFYRKTGFSKGTGRNRYVKKLPVRRP